MLWRCVHCVQPFHVVDGKNCHQPLHSWQNEAPLVHQKTLGAPCPRENRPAHHYLLHSSPCNCSFGWHFCPPETTEIIGWNRATEGPMASEEVTWGKLRSHSIMPHAPQVEWSMWFHETDKHSTSVARVKAPVSTDWLFLEMPGKHPHIEDPSSMAKTHTFRKCWQKPWKGPLLWPQSMPTAPMHECFRLQQSGETTNNELIFQAASQSLT